MFVLFFSLFASQETVDFQHYVENTFDLTRCTSYVLQQPLFPVNPVSEQTEHHINLYVPYESWAADRYQWQIESSKNAPDNQALECFLITNGYAGKELFFAALSAGQLGEWDKIDARTMPQASFYGYKHVNSQTLALVGLYRELSPRPLIGSKFTVCGVGAPYIQEKERKLQDEDTRRYWQRQFGPGNVVVVYPAGGAPYGNSQFARANFC